MASKTRSASIISSFPHSHSSFFSFPLPFLYSPIISSCCLLCFFFSFRDVASFHAISPVGMATGEFFVDWIAFFSFVIMFWFSFRSHVPQSPTILLSSSFFCATMPLAAPLLSSHRHRPYGGLASPASGAGGRRTTLRGGYPSLVSFWDLGHLGLFQPWCLNASWVGSSWPGSNPTLKKQNKKTKNK